MSGEGLIDVASRGPRGRKAYKITDAGLVEIRRWLTETEVDHTMRLEPLLRSLFFWLMDPAELAAHLEREAAFYTERAAFYRDYARRKDAGEFGTGPRVQAMRVTIEGGIRVYQALAEWAEWAGSVPGRDDHDQDEDQGEPQHHDAG